jgi:trimeric autotransporter adhesin
MCKTMKKQFFLLLAYVVTMFGVATAQQKPTSALSAEALFESDAGIPNGWKMNVSPKGEASLVPAEAKETANASDNNWSNLPHLRGLNGTVRAIVIDGNDVYVGGTFGSAGGVPGTSFIARWNGGNWYSVGGGLNNVVYSLDLRGGVLYAGGAFTLNFEGETVRCLGKISTAPNSAWEYTGHVDNGIVYAIAATSNFLYAGGTFTSVAFGNPASRIARFYANGNNDVMLPGVDGTVFAIARTTQGSNPNDYVNIGGNFITAGGITVNRVAILNSYSINQWLPTLNPDYAANGPVGVNGPVFAIAMSQGPDPERFYVGGSFTEVCGVSCPYFSQNKGLRWDITDKGVGGIVRAIVTIPNEDGSLIIGGEFATCTNFDGTVVQTNGVAFTYGGGATINYVWTPLGNGLGSGTCFAVAGTSAQLYAGGFLFNASGVPGANFIARWDGTTWNSMLSNGTDGVNGDALAIARTGNGIYVGGAFTTAASVVPASNIALWNGSFWSAVGTGLNGTVRAMATAGNNVYAGGDFTNAGGNTNANYVAMWNGTSWQALGSGLNGTVRAIAVSGSTVFVAGDFVDAGGDGNADRIAMWNGSNWQSLGVGLDGRAFALAVSGSNLYVGGEFFTAGGVSANRIAVWNGSNWSALGSGMNDIVRTILVRGSSVFAGGTFTTAGGNSANLAAVWNGFSWADLGLGAVAFGDYVSSLSSASNNNLYAGGRFVRELVPGSIINHVAQLNGATWSPLGSGTDNPVQSVSVATDPSDASVRLFTGGSFANAGNKSASRAARWLIYSDNQTRGSAVATTQTAVRVEKGYQLEQNYPNPFNPSTTIRFNVAKAGVAQLSVYDVLGREVYKTQVQATSGVNAINFDGSRLASGTYLYRLQSGNFVQTRKMLLVK